MTAVLDSSPAVWTGDDEDLLNALWLRDRLAAGGEPELVDDPHSNHFIPRPFYLSSTAQRYGWSPGYTTAGSMPDIYYPRVKAKWAQDPIGAFAILPFVLVINAISWCIAVSLHLLKHGTSHIIPDTTVKAGGYVSEVGRVLFARDGIYFPQASPTAGALARGYDSIADLQYNPLNRAVRVHQIFGPNHTQTEDLTFPDGNAASAFVLLTFLCPGSRRTPLVVPDWFAAKSARFGRSLPAEVSTGR